MEIGSLLGIAFIVLVLCVLASGVRIVPQKEEHIVERLGKFHCRLGAGFNIIVPIIDRIAYKQSLKETLISIPRQDAITADNTSISVSGNVYVTVIDSVDASYNVNNWQLAVKELSQTVMRSAIGAMQLDETFSSRDQLNQKIVASVTERSSKWGIQVSSYELNEVEPSPTVKASLESQMKAEREKRATVLEAEAKKQDDILRAEGQKASEILKAEGQKASEILNAEAQKEKDILKAQGEAEAKRLNAEADALSLELIRNQMQIEGTDKAVQFDIMKRAISAKEALAKESTVMLLSDKQSDIGESIASALAITNNLKV